MNRRTRKCNKPRTLPLGTLAEATTRACDWIDGLLWALDCVHLSRADRFAVRKLATEYADIKRDVGQHGAEFDDAGASDILGELINIAENYRPAYSDLGTLDGDGACFGVWPSIDSLQEDIRAGEVWTLCPRGEGYRIPGTIALKVPRGAYYASISDHGNVTLYQATARGLREIWSVV